MWRLTAVTCRAALSVEDVLHVDEIMADDGSKIADVHLVFTGLRIPPEECKSLDQSANPR